MAPNRNQNARKLDAAKTHLDRLLEWCAAYARDHDGKEPTQTEAIKARIPGLANSHDLRCAWSEMMAEKQYNL